jgi:hypothetical protein
MYKFSQDYISFYMNEKTDIFIQLEKAFFGGLIVNE